MTPQQTHTPAPPANQAALRADPLIRQAVELLLPFGPVRVGVFGSYARGTAQDDSDLDLVVRFPAQASWWDQIAAEQALTQQLGRPVHILSEGGLTDSFRQSIAPDWVVVYEQESHKKPHSTTTA